jgi:hypothetical protein
MATLVMSITKLCGYYGESLDRLHGVPSEMGAGMAGVGFMDAARVRAVQRAGSRLVGIRLRLKRRFRRDRFGRHEDPECSGTPQKVRAAPAIA